MTTIWNKFDSGLSGIYRDYLHLQEHGPKRGVRLHSIVENDDRFQLSMEYQGSLTEIEALGFRTIAVVEAGRATGSVALGDIERIAAHPGVKRLSYGRKEKSLLNTSVPDIRANQAALSGGGFDGITGKGVVVGIVDSGIDFDHPFFLSTTDPPTTRILSIWDLGLLPQPGEKGPDKNLLAPGTADTYGVEYKREQINDVLQKKPGAKVIHHRDCSGHGTHVASIAAGNDSHRSKYVGVAPAADIIVVKTLSLANEPKVGDTKVNPTQRRKDVVAYIINKAKPKPVVINYSLGISLGPHDGQTEWEDFLRQTLVSQTGVAVVAAAGNDAGDKQHLRIEFPAGGAECEIKCLLFDYRGNRRSYATCDWKDATDYLELSVYYANGGSTLTGGFQTPDRDAPVPGPVLGGDEANANFRNHRVAMEHKIEERTLLDGRGIVKRNTFTVDVYPFRNRHEAGIYTLKLRSDGQLQVHLWCDGATDLYGFQISDPVPEIAHLEDKYQINSPAGAEGVICVASYDDTSPTDAMDNSSSRGPLLNYNVGGPSPPDKPDIAAPGVNIRAARSWEANPFRYNTAELSGTSMSVPHVTGAVALMFQKNPNLSATEIMVALKEHPRPLTTSEHRDDLGSGRLDVLAALNDTPV